MLSWTMYLNMSKIVNRKFHYYFNQHKSLQLSRITKLLCKLTPIAYHEPGSSPIMCRYIKRVHPCWTYFNFVSPVK